MCRVKVKENPTRQDSKSVKGLNIYISIFFGLALLLLESAHVW